MDETKIRSRWIELAFFSLLITGSLLLSFHFHRGTGEGRFLKELSADRGGYFIYLPALFYFHFDAQECPEKLDEKAGSGFSLDTDNHKIRTKYFCGEAVLLLPFFTGATIASRLLGIPADYGFSPLFMHAMILAALFYLIAGLWILKRVLDQFFKETTSYLVVFFLLAGTNLFYYSLADGLMTHVYSFFLFSLFLLATIRFYSTGRYKWFILVACTISLATLVRPTHLILLPVFLLWDAGSLRNIPGRTRKLLNPAYSLVFLFILIVVFLPQLFYWRYLSGSFFYYPYAGEGFTHLLDPYLVESWFAPLNGLFAYSPLVLVFVAGMVWMVLARKTNGWLFLALFVFISYLFSSWYSWYYGCGFGQRSYIEFYALFSIPFGFLVEKSLEKRNLFVKFLFFLLIIIMSYFCLRLSLLRILNNSRCFYGSTWDWYTYQQKLESAGLYNPGFDRLVFTNDFENYAISREEKRTEYVARSGFNSILFNHSTGFGAFYRTRLEKAGYPEFRTVDAEVWMLCTNPFPTHAVLVCSVEKDGRSLLWQGVKADKFNHEPGKWFRVGGTFVLLDGLDPSADLTIYIWNQGGKGFFADDLRVEIR